MIKQALVGLAAAMLATAAFAQGTPNSVELTPMAGYWFGDTLARGTTNSFDFDVTIDDAPAYGLRVGYKFNENFGLEGTLVRERADLITGKKELFGGQSKLGEITLTTAEVGVEGSFGHGRLVPFLAGGIGGMNLDPNLAGMSSDTRFVANIGGGLKLFFSPDVALRLDWRGHSVKVGNTHDHCDWWEDCSHNHDWITFTELSLGLTFVL